MTPKKLEELLEKTRNELTLVYEIGNALRTTLDFDETVHIILTSVTAQTGLSFNRAAIFLMNESQNQLVGRMGIGAPLENSSFNQAVTSLKIPLRERAGGLFALNALEGRPMEVIRPQAQRRATQDPVLRVLKSTSCVLVPLKSRDNRVVGVIFADNRITLKPITRESFRLLALLAAHAGLAIENSRLYEMVLQQADLDSLTGLWNRGAFQRALMSSVEAAQRTGTPMSLLLLDMDHFKAYNDKVGHLEGDQALRRVARLLKETARTEDYVARFGGEEFAVILPKASKINAMKLAERIRLAMTETTLPLTLSAGVATFPQDAQEAEGLLKSVDLALYEAKHRGRNRVAIA